MKTAVIFSVFAASASAFAPAASKPSFNRSPALNGVPLANGAMEFDRVCREWRCKYTGDKATSESLEAISKVVDEYLPTIKGISDGVKVNRLVCGSCLDFKLMITVPLDDFGPWEESGHAPEAEFLEKLKAIDGVSQVETQTITNVEI
mmetsp:Transcript_33636/g.74109  ORF Transcript_33636/g.74109 Transcript_33636/m.74109 type:complete len:148 (+) Transcript_33636:59-502(+)|eukprot:CAMPEP_0178471372 /NCGR_PEP_ID=MMETSP0696-20121128/1011_1 /TAXON_ID=265572 /ORGANISM="Extubocellulus spinifer, Strain CCMP396" /LENGTH=147 /DNA_ID=CAMNT_0020098509 /DNA_START=9 /DNA_END=452 /DNA_ORIENTATION=-